MRAIEALRFLPLALLTGLAAFVVVGKLRVKPRPVDTSAAVSPNHAVASVETPALARSVGTTGTFSPVLMAHGGPLRRHRSEAKGPRAIHRAWRAELGGPIQGQIVSSPDERTLYAATLGGALVALDRATGAERFRVELGDRAYGAPCVSPDGAIFVGSDAKRFFGVRPDGAIAFRLEIEGEADTSCAIAGGLVYFAAGANVYAVRSRGDVAWRFRTKGKVFTAPLVLDDGLVVVGAQDDHVYGLRDGKAVFTTAVGADVDGAPVALDDGGIAVGTDAGEVVFLDHAGQIRARSSLGGFVRGELALAHDGAVLAGVYGPTPRAVRISAGADGGSAAIAIAGAFAIPGTGSPEFGVHGGGLEDREGVVFFGGEDDAVYAVGPSGLLFRYDAGGDVDAPLTLLGDGSLVVASDAGHCDLLSP